MDKKAMAEELFRKADEYDQKVIDECEKLKKKLDSGEQGTEEDLKRIIDALKGMKEGRRLSDEAIKLMKS